MEAVLGPLTSIPLGEGRNFKAQGACIAVFRARDGELFATQATCPHRGGPLADGILGAAKLVCPLHSSTFDLRTGQAVVGDFGLKIYPIKLNSDGQLVVSI
jgi:nitrite reductase (NADH) small subunit